MIRILFKHPLPLSEAHHPILSKLSQAFLGFLDGFFLVEVRLAEEFISIADDFLLQGLWQKVLVRQRQSLCDDFLASDSGTRVSLAYTSMSLIAFLAQDFRSQSSMTDVGLRAETLYARGIRAEDSQVVKHGCLLYKLGIEMQFRMRRNNL